MYPLLMVGLTIGLFLLLASWPFRAVAREMRAYRKTVLAPRGLPEELLGAADSLQIKREILNQVKAYGQEIAVQEDPEREHTLTVWAINRAVARVEYEYRLLRHRVEGGGR